MSRRLALLNAVLRRAVRPALARTQTPERAAFEFGIGGRLMRVPWGTRVVRRPVPGPARPITVERIACGPVRDDGLILWLHGGGYVAGSPRTHRAMLARLSRAAGLRVAAPAYRRVPEAVLPAAHDDALAVWDALLAEGRAPDRIVLGGDSAGGGLAFGLLAALCARGGPVPAGVLAFSPWVDLTLSGASLTDNAAADPLLPAARLPELVAMVTDGADPADPRLSPLFGRFPGAPPVLILAGSTEILRDDSRRMGDRLAEDGAEVTVELWPDAPHVWPFFGDWLPESRVAIARTGAFAAACLQTAAPANR